jgi:CRP/FNR family transcriptional regulator, cyclic AMP receptor protein
LLEALRSQVLVSHDAELAQALADAGELEEFQKGETLIKQGDPDNDILFIVHGEVSILANERVVATRAAGTHVGEMALVDHLARRGATVKATDLTTVLRVAEHKFTSIANKRPELWRRVAIEIAKRLRERNRAVTPPREEPVLFIGSSSEGIKIVDAVHATAKRWKVVRKPWTDGVFEASSTTIESLMALTKEADFALLILTADDVTNSRGKRKPSPRDNVIFELGLLMGALGRERVFILKPKQLDIRIPTDLLGVTWLDYRRGGPGRLRSKLSAACTSILKRINTLGPR